VNAPLAAQDPPRDPADRVRLALQCGAVAGTWEWDVETGRFAGDAGFARALSLDFAKSGGWLPASAVAETVHPEDWPTIEAVRSLAAVDGDRHSVEFRVRQPDGTCRWLQSNGCCIDRDGSPRRFVGILIDIDARKGTEERLHQREEEAREASALLQAVIEAVPALIYVKDRGGRLQVANAAVMALAGKPWDEVKNRTDAEFLDDPDEAARIMATDRRLMETAGEEELEEIVGSDEGGPRIWLSHKKAFRNPDGVVTGLVGTSVDITSRKRAEERIAASEAKLRRVIDSMFAFVGIMDIDGTLVEANRAPIEGAGLKYGDVIGKPFWDAYWWSYDPAVRARIRAAAERARDGQTSRFDVEVRWRGDRRITIDLQIAPLRNEAGAVIRLIPFGVDVTARKDAEAQRQTLILELNHRVQNLFTVASAMIRISARQARTPDELADAVTGRLAALARAHALIRPAITGETGSQGALLAELMAAVIAPHVTPGGRQLRLGGTNVLLGGEAATAIALVFHELATNSAKYGALSAPDGQLDVRWSDDGGDLVVTWRETGGPAIESAPARSGFGSQLIKSTVAGQLGGEILFDWSTDGLLVTLAAKLERLNGSAAPA
jgi:PAS domain S-box-containing protein